MSDGEDKMKKPAMSTIILLVIALIFLFIAVTVKGGGFQTIIGTGLRPVPVFKIVLI